MSGNVVCALVKKGSSLLPGVGIEMEEQAVELELCAGDGVGGVGCPERGEVGCGQPFQLTHARVRAFQNGGRIQLFLKHANAGCADGRIVESLGQQLQDDEVAVFIDDQAGQFVGFAEAETAGVCLIHQSRHVTDQSRQAAENGGAEAGFKQRQPRGFIQRLAGDQPQRNLRGGAIERGSQQQAAAIGNRQQRWRFAGAGFDELDVRGVDPEMADAKPISGAAADRSANDP